MPLFGRKKEEIEKEIKDIEEIKQAIEPLKAPKIEEKIPEPEKPTSAPLFIKLDKYRKILDSLTELKTALEAIKNAFATLNELEKLKAESLKAIENAVEKVGKKTIALDSEFLRPSGYQEEVPSELFTTESLGLTITDLRSHIEQIKSELQSMT